MCAGGGRSNLGSRTIVRGAADTAQVTGSGMVVDNGSRRKTELSKGGSDFALGTSEPRLDSSLRETTRRTCSTFARLGSRKGVVVPRHRSCAGVFSGLASVVSE